MVKTWSVLSILVALVAALFMLVPSLRSSLPFLGPDEVSEEQLRIEALAVAQNYSYTTVLDDPPVIYLDDFLSEAEIAEILNTSSPLFVPSQVYSPDDKAPKHRTSSSCLLPDDSPLASVIATRALQFLSNVTKTAPPTAPRMPEPLSYYGLEKIQLVKYLPSQYYHHHMDWFDTLLRDDLPGKGKAGRGQGRYYNRVASFFIYLEDECTGGGTEFPDLDFSIESAAQQGRLKPEEFWNERIDFAHVGDNKSVSGISFKPRKGSGVFWVNLLPIGYGDERLRHAGLPVQDGQKVGMNIWVKRDFGW
ncbi:uncharacterized protein PV06_05161 [Exophiala oligosperma]|uniref:Prolyl 4-hydroxylase alpha subunit domain-containing protein n=2 Tax=Chaetothyriales TaxID=34395 RepID=A0A0D2C2Y0_9EURO|nr:uncharacterized protein PV06_05161 [Exophiala oligosperma]KAJ9644176.1 hypothetical protein H2204_001527 [Knufia peltigerae]KIW44127.1 hypothetical protein PV06_05161 [Exophiala oligosperma]